MTPKEFEALIHTTQDMLEQLEEDWRESIAEPRWKLECAISALVVEFERETGAAVSRIKLANVLAGGMTLGNERSIAVEASRKLRDASAHQNRADSESFAAFNERMKSTCNGDAAKYVCTSFDASAKPAHTILGDATVTSAKIADDAVAAAKHGDREFKPGDVVYLKSGGPDMTIDDVRKPCGWAERLYRCTWFASGELRSAEFIAEALNVLKRSTDNDLVAIPPVDPRLVHEILP